MSMSERHDAVQHISVPRPRITTHVPEQAFTIVHEPGAEGSRYQIGNWEPDVVDQIFALEWLTWPPWLQKPFDRINNIANDPVRKKTHFIAQDSLNSDEVVASMSVTRTKWNGDPLKVKQWDKYAGGDVTKSDYPEYDTNGNTFVIMSSGVDPEHRGQHIIRQLFDELKSLSRQQGIKNIIGPFRPSGYGRYKREQFDNGKEVLGFEAYCERVIKESEKAPELRDHEFEDPWLQAALHMGMEPLRADRRLCVEEESMKVTVDEETFKEYQKYYKHDLWWERTDPVSGKILLECDEAGSWTKTDDGKYTYTEPNLLGKVPITQPTAQP
jgi:GNAT superfamily N-acetyltransferase